jgi:hypothetical protein
LIARTRDRHFGGYAEMAWCGTASIRLWATTDGGCVQQAVSLIVPKRQLPKPGEEVTFNYGNKSNEELLFLYGVWLASGAIPDINASYPVVRDGPSHCAAIGTRSNVVCAHPRLKSDKHN